MKISSTNPDHGIPQLDQSDSSSDALLQPSEAIFDQILQLLSHLSPIPVEINKINENESNEVSLNEEVSKPINNDVNKVLDNSNHHSDDAMTFNSVYELMDQFGDIKQKLIDNNSLFDLNQHDAVKNTSDFYSMKQIHTDNMYERSSGINPIENTVVVNNEIENKKTSDVSEKSIDESLNLLNQQNDPVFIKDVIKKSSSSSDHNIQEVIKDSSENLNLSINLTDKIKQIEQPMTKPKKQNEFFIQTPYVSIESLNNHDVPQILTSSIPFETSNKIQSDRNNQTIDAFINLGHLINNQTSEALVEHNSGNTNQIKSNPMNPNFGHFDPFNDFKFNISTSNSTPSHLTEIYDAKIKIYPPELGHVLAKLKVNNDNAELIIMTENEHVKQIVESNLSLLKQHFHDADIHLTQVDIQTASSGQKWQENGHQSQQQQARDDQSNEIKPAQLTHKAPRVDDNAIIDTYA